MATISTQDARAVFTQALISVYKERTAPTAFLRSFFVNKEVNTLQLRIEVQRGTEKIAVDVERGTEGNRNQFSKSSEKIFIPPYYKEYFDATDLDFYDRLFTSTGTVDLITFNQWVDTVVEKLGMLQDKIERSYELQASQVLETGIVTLTNGDNIIYPRKAPSLVALAGPALWDAGTSNPYTDMENSCNFARTKGKVSGNIFNFIFGTAAFNAFLNNTVVKERADIRRISLDAIRMPQKESFGGVLHGEVSVGSYVCRLWTYPEYYDTEAAENIPYMNPKKYVCLPDNPKFVAGFAGVPQIMGKQPNIGAGVAAKRGAYLVEEVLDELNTAHIIRIKSAGLMIPVGIDQFSTTQVLA